MCKLGITPATFLHAASCESSAMNCESSLICVLCARECGYQLQTAHTSHKSSLSPCQMREGEGRGGRRAEGKREEKGKGGGVIEEG